jgi:tetratricopeptide (TPR) repeat protein
VVTILAHDLLMKGVAAQHAGRLSDAKHIYEQVLAANPRHPDALNLLGLIALQGGDAEGGARLISQAVQVDPSNPAFHANLAQAYISLQRIADAHMAFGRAAALDPGNPQFTAGAAVCQALQGRTAAAEQQLRRVLAQHPDYPLAWYNLGNLLRDGNRLEEAADSYRRVIQLDPSFADAHGDLGHILHRTERFADAEQAYRRHLSLEPGSAIGHFNLASLLIDLGRGAEAVEACRQGIERVSGSAGSSQLHWMLGSALVQQGRLDAALAAFGTASSKDPSNARPVWGLGLALLHTGSPQQGLRWLLRGLDLAARSPEFSYAMAGVYLSLGDLQAGWREYQSRPARAWFVHHFPLVSLASELPGLLEGKTILLSREQGLGDELFFLRFAPGLKSRGATVTYRANAKIVSMLGRVAALDRVVTEDVPLPEMDLAVLVGDLPRMLGSLPSSPYPAADDPRAAIPPAPVFQRLSSIHYPEPPAPLLLTPLQEHLHHMQRQLSQLGPPPYLGLTWRAGTAPEQQRGSVWLLHKEIPLEPLGSVLRGVNGTLLSLQRNPRPGEIEALSAHAARPVHDLTELNEGLEAMLALLALIDDYIGVSNTNMHLRAAAGRTARVLLPRPAEWRWMISGTRSPWFPGFRIYRQGPDGDWRVAFQRLAQSLEEQFGPRQ